MTKANENIPEKLPVLIRVSSTLIIIISIVGFLFFAIASIYQYYNPQLLNEISRNNNQYIHLDIYVIIQAILYFGIVVSVLLIIKQKKTGLYLFFSVVVVLLINELYFENILIFNHLIIGILGLPFVIYYRRFK